MSAPTRAPRRGRVRAAATAFAALAALAAAVGPAAAQIPLRPAAPQPDEASLKPGLAVRYAFPADLRWLGSAITALRDSGRPGQPLVGLDYPDKGLGQPTLTSSKAEFVAAEIKGFVRFDQAGVWQLEVHSNDGVALEIGGAAVDRFDGRRTCETNGWISVNVPSPGWYPVDAIFFQRYNSSCLMMRWQKPDGTREWTPQSAWAFTPE